MILRGALRNWQNASRVINSLDKERLAHWSLIVVTFLLAIVTTSLAVVTWSLYHVSSLQESLSVAGETAEPTLTVSVRTVPSLVVHTTSDHGEKIIVFCVAASSTSTSGESIVKNLKASGMIRPIAGQLDRTMRPLLIPCVEYPISYKFFSPPRYVYAFLSYSSAILKNAVPSLNAWEPHVYQYDGVFRQYQNEDSDKPAFAHAAELANSLTPILASTSIAAPVGTTSASTEASVAAALPVGAAALNRNQPETLSP
jgi:hypothetical protein